MNAEATDRAVEYWTDYCWTLTHGRDADDEWWSGASDALDQLSVAYVVDYPTAEIEDVIVVCQHNPISGEYVEAGRVDRSDYAGDESACLDVILMCERLVGGDA